MDFWRNSSKWNNSPIAKHKHSRFFRARIRSPGRNWICFSFLKVKVILLLVVLVDESKSNVRDFSGKRTRWVLGTEGPWIRVFLWCFKWDNVWWTKVLESVEVPWTLLPNEIHSSLVTNLLNPRTTSNFSVIRFAVSSVGSRRFRSSS